MDAQFADPVADRLDIAGMALGKTVETRDDETASALVAQSLPPLPEGFGLSQFEHGEL
ncbi:hypothetical protein [Aurantimonas sp. Leaf443]|uniref:hypothetical protein n=1 Tax=Aurantimonas sp. Leaf443 TaxID=1736378 RepID=UPI000B33C674